MMIPRFCEISVGRTTAAEKGPARTHGEDEPKTTTSRGLPGATPNGVRLPPASTIMLSMMLRRDDHAVV